MDIQKEREAFENKFPVPAHWIDFDGLTCKYICKYNAIDDQALKYQARWESWLVAKAQAVPEGFVLVPKELSDELADELASDAFNNIQSMFDYEHRGSTATHRKQIRLRWCKNKARDFQENYKVVIEAQEQNNADVF